MNLASTYTQPTSVLLLGTPGAGKSTLAAQFPDCFVLDCDENYAGPIRYLNSQPNPPKFYIGSPLYAADGKSVPPQDRFRRAMVLLDEAANSDLIKTIVVDSLTTFVDMVLYEVMREQGRKIGDFSFKTSTSKAMDEQLQIQDWGFFLGTMKKVIFSLKGTGKTIVFTGHIKVREDEVSKLLRQAVAVPGQFADIISGLFSEVWLLERETKRTSAGSEELYFVTTFPSGKIDQGLGLKSACGLKSGSKIEPKELLAKLFQK